MRNVLTDMPQHGVGRRLARRTGTDDITHVSERIADVFELFNRLEWIVHCLLQHCLGMQGNVGPGPGVTRRR